MDENQAKPADEDQQQVLQDDQLKDVVGGQQSSSQLVNPGDVSNNPSLSNFSAVSIPGWSTTGTPSLERNGTRGNNA